MSTSVSRAASFTLSVASGDALDVREFVVEERMSSLFSITVTAVAESPDVDFEAIIGRPARFEARAGVAGAERSRVWTGICKEVREVAVEEQGLSTYAIELAPSLWLADLRRNHRMFQGRSDVEIALALLSEWGLEPIQRLSGAYKRRKYRVQYGESDYAFFSRLLEDAGVSFHFVEAGGETRLVLADAPQSGDLREPKIRFRDNPGDADLEHVSALRLGRRVRSGRYTVRDHDHRRPPAYKLAATAATSGVEEKLERYHYTPGAFLFESEQGDPTPSADDRGRYRTDETEAAAIAQRRLDAERAEALSYSFGTNAIDLAPGVVFGVREHPRRDLGEDRRLLVVAARMRGAVGEAWKIEGEARRADVPHRPALSTPRPKVSGVESATVVGPPGEEIHTDEFGRVRVHFHWDRESRMDDRSSCWIHVSQPWSGAGYGGVNLPRVGQEVLVDFLGGDPDRPIIVGRVYTNLQRVPYDLPEHRTQSGWKSQSTKGTGGYNEIMFEDEAGQELVRLRAQRDLVEDVLVNRTQRVGGHRQARVEGADRLEIGQDRGVRVGGVSAERVGADRALEVLGSQSESVAGNLARTVGGDERVTIGGNLEQAIKAGFAASVEGPYTLSIGSAAARSAGQVSVNGSYTLGATDLSIFAERSITLACGASSIRITPDGIVVSGTAVSLAGTEAVTAKGPGPSLTLSDHAEIAAKGIKLRAENASVELDRDAEVRGTHVRLESGQSGPPAKDGGDDPETRPLRIKLSDVNMNPYAEKRYELFAGGLRIEGATDADGFLTEDVPATADLAQVTLWIDEYPEGRRRRWAIRIEDLPPLTEVRGAKQRLRNLGYLAGPADDQRDADLGAALRWFQRDHEIDATGELDGPTAAALHRVHGH